MYRRCSQPAFQQVNYFIKANVWSEQELVALPTPSVSRVSHRQTLAGPALETPLQGQVEGSGAATAALAAIALRGRGCGCHSSEPS